MSEIDAEVLELRQRLGYGAAISLLVAILVSTFFSSRLLRPIRALSEGARIIEGGNLDHAITVHARDELGQLAGAFNDMTSKLREMVARALEGNRTKSGFLANMSHEIRTPMTSIIGYADLLLDPALSEGDRSGHVETIRRSGSHLLQIINDILDLSKIEAGKMSVDLVPCSVPQVVAEVASLMRLRAKEKGLGFEATFNGRIPESIQSDAMRLRQIAIHLVGNAIKFTEQGSVRIAVRCDAPDGPSPMLEIEVVDTGIGLTPDQTDRLFTPFSQADASTTRRFGGTGLGLTICKRFAHLLGGDLTLESAPGRGSAFTLAIPTGDLRGVRMLDCATEAMFRAGEQGVRVAVHGGRGARPAGGGRPRQPAAPRDVPAPRRGRGDHRGERAARGGVRAPDAVRRHPDGHADARARRLRCDVSLAARGVQAPDRRPHARDGGRPRAVPASRLRRLDALIGMVARWGDSVDGARESAAASGLDPVGADVAPLVCTLAGGDDLQDLVVTFVGRLSGQANALRDAFSRGDLETVRVFAHQLKGAAGGFGFATITEAAGAGERALVESASREIISGHIDVVTSLCGRARAA